MRSHQAAIQAFEGEIGIGRYVYRRVIGVAGQKADAIARMLQHLDGDFIVHACDDDLAAACESGAMDADQIAIDQPTYAPEPR